jgi:hypothetical protein
MASQRVRGGRTGGGGSNWGVPSDYRNSEARAQEHQSLEKGSLPDAEETALRALLQSIGAEAAFEALRQERIDTEALALMKEGDLREAGVPLGPRKKLLASGLCAQPARVKETGVRVDWDLESESDVNEMQKIAPTLVLHLKSGRVHSISSDVADAGIFVHEEDEPFVILMSKVERSTRDFDVLLSTLCVSVCSLGR